MAIISQNEPQIKIYPGLWAAASRRRVDRWFRVWLVARHIDAGGSGWVRVSDLARFAKAHRLAGFANLRRLIHDKRAAVFWTVSGSGLALRSLERVGFDLADGVNPFAGAPVWFPASSFRSVATFRAAAYAATLPSRPTSRAALTRKTGRAGQTLRRYEHVAGVARVKNRVLIGKQRTPWCVDDLVRAGALAPGETPTHRIWLTHGVGGWFVAYEILPNSYDVAPLDVAPVGRLKRCRRVWRACFERQVSAIPSRRYFDNPTDALRRRDKSAPGYVYIGPWPGCEGVAMWERV